MVVIRTTHRIRRSISDELSVKEGLDALSESADYLRCHLQRDIIYFTRGVLKVSTIANDYKPEMEYV